MEYKNNIIKVAYKLLNDVLVLLLLAFLLLMVSDGLLPGIISSHLSFAKLILLIFTTLGAIIFLGKRSSYLYPDFNLKQSRLVFALVAISFLVIGNSMLKFSYFQNILITSLTLAIYYYLYKIIFSQPK